MNLGFEDTGFGPIPAVVVECRRVIVRNAIAYESAFFALATERVFFRTVLCRFALISEGRTFPFKARKSILTNVVFVVARPILAFFFDADRITTNEFFFAQLPGSIALTTLVEFVHEISAKPFYALQIIGANDSFVIITGFAFAHSFGTNTEHTFEAFFTNLDFVVAKIVKRLD